MEDRRSPVERLLKKDPEALREAPRRLSERAAQYQRTLEGYLQAGNMPRWMERLADIQRATNQERAALERAYESLKAQHTGDPAVFEQRWRETAESWPFGQVNVLIGQHNDWFPIERQLAVDPRTRDYVLINGRSYRRTPLDAEWVLLEFPPRLGEDRGRGEQRA
jgi:hypothetical protein